MYKILSVVSILIISISGFAQMQTKPDSNEPANITSDMASMKKAGSPDLFSDPSFGNHGKVYTDFYQRTDTPSAAIMQPDGRILVTGSTLASGVFQFAICRYWPDGSLDLTFGNQGKVTTSIVNKQDRSHAICLQPDGKILVAGSAFIGTNPGGYDYDFAVARYLPHGVLDPAFGENGITHFSLTTYMDEVLSLDVEDDGKIVLSGNAGWQADYLALARLSPDGSLDPSFGNNGKLRIQANQTWNFCNLVRTYPGKKILIAGTANLPYNRRDFIAMLKDNGDIDETFGINGFDTTDIYIRDIKVLPDGKILTAGEMLVDSTSDMAVARYNPDGSIDPSFGINGLTVINIPNSSEAATCLKLNENNRIFVSGIATDSKDLAFCASLYPSGGVDTSYLENGSRVFTTNDETGASTPIGSILQENGKVLVLEKFTSGDTSDFKLSRYLTGLPLRINDLQSKTSSMRIYPNPNQGSFYLDYNPSLPGTSEIRVLDLSGKIVYTYPMNISNSTISVHQLIQLPDRLSCGMYILDVMATGQKQSTILLIE